MGEKPILVLIGYTMIVIAFFMMPIQYALCYFQYSDNYYNFSIFLFFPIIALYFKHIQLIAEDDYSSFSNLKWLNTMILNEINPELNEIQKYRILVILNRSCILVHIFLGALLYYYSLPEEFPLPCAFYWFLFEPVFIELVISIESLPVEEIKHCLLIDNFFLVTLTTVLALGNCNFTCLIICGSIVILYEAMCIEHIWNAEIVMKNEKSGQVIEEKDFKSEWEVCVLEVSE
uniref:Uncharacterized protein n=3 Tax=Caenorhabditis tropicalis TaxID=1561998 RepID=A0A1I7UYL4_9PELO